jgi:putative SOS response-associated peptidase YedK
VTIVQRPGEPPSVQDAKWGLVPFWAKPQPGLSRSRRKPPPINARAETLSTSAMFRLPFVESRCLIPATGFYEWRASGGTRTPMHILLRDGAPFAFAGLWARGHHGGPPTALIVTTRPNELLSTIHNRMPAILRPEHEARWLDPSITDPDELLALLEPFPAELMQAYQVAPLVNSFKNESPELILPVSADTPVQIQLFEA